MKRSAPLSLVKGGAHMQGEPTDAELMARIQADDRAAFRLFVRRHEASIRGFLRRMTTEEADDLVQETFTALWTSRARYEERGQARAFLFRLARDRGRKHLRWRSVRLAFRRASSFDDGFTPDKSPTTTRALSLSTVMPGAFRDPLDVLEEGRERLALERALGLLPVVDRELVHLRFVDALSYREIALVLGGDEAAHRQRAHRAVAKLRAHFADEEAT